MFRVRRESTPSALSAFCFSLLKKKKNCSKDWVSASGWLHTHETTSENEAERSAVAVAQPAFLFPISSVFASSLNVRSDQCRSSSRRWLNIQRSAWRPGRPPESRADMWRGRRRREMKLHVSFCTVCPVAVAECLSLTLSPSFDFLLKFELRNCKRSCRLRLCGHKLPALSFCSLHTMQNVNVSIFHEWKWKILFSVRAKVSSKTDISRATAPVDTPAVIGQLHTLFFRGALTGPRNTCALIRLFNQHLPDLRTPKMPNLASHRT